MLDQILFWLFIGTQQNLFAQQLGGLNNHHFIISHNFMDHESREGLPEQFPALHQLGSQMGWSRGPETLSLKSERLGSTGTIDRSAHTWLFQYANLRLVGLITWWTAYVALLPKIGSTDQQYRPHLPGSLLEDEDSLPHPHPSPSASESTSYQYSQWFVHTLMFEKHWPVGQTLTSLRYSRSSFIWHLPYLCGVKILYSFLDFQMQDHWATFSSLHFILHVSVHCSPCL